MVALCLHCFGGSGNNHSHIDGDSGGDNKLGANSNGDKRIGGLSFFL